MLRAEKTQGREPSDSSGNALIYNSKHMFDMMKLMGKMKEVQSKIAEAKENLVHLTAEGESGGGMVHATVNGHKQVVKVEIDPQLLKPEDQEMTQDLVVAAINVAMERVDERVKAEMKKHTDGLLPNIPGLDLNF